MFNQLIINKIFIPNRGEIAARIIRTAQRLGIKTVVTLAKHESDTLPALMADEVFWWSSELLNETFLNVDAIIAAALSVGADAIHPGYGFLSENHHLAKACEDNNLIFIGPHPVHIELMGRKTEARRMAQAANIPVVPGWDGTVDEIMAQSHLFTFPVLVKAAMGGGGKGMQQVYSVNELKELLERTANEANRYFGDETVFVEQYFENARHLEVQLLGDVYGEMIHLGVRECSIQRRYQKIIEEAPAPNLHTHIREALQRDAVKLALFMKYINAGTIEFLVNDNGDHFFLEMNTRIQVEYPVTELITGVDIVEMQIEIACGLPLKMKQQAIHFKGHAIESRLYAEDASQSFKPSPGRINQFIFPQNAETRIDTAISQPLTVHSNYDPLIAKIATWGVNREAAISKHQAALEACSIIGITTNLPYLLQIVKHPSFVEGNYHTRFCELYHSELIVRQDVLLVLIAYAQLKFHLIDRNNKVPFFRHLPVFSVMIEDQIYHIRYRLVKEHIHLIINDIEHVIKDSIITNNTISYHYNSKKYLHFFYLTDNQIFIDTKGNVSQLTPCDWLQPHQLRVKVQPVSYATHLLAPLPGRIVKINVNEGDTIVKGETLLVLETMKMENYLKAWKDLTISEIHILEGHSVHSNQLLITTL